MSGMIGGRNRSVGSDAGNILAGMIQTDAAINPGNSGETGYEVHQSPNDC